MRAYRWTLALMAFASACAVFGCSDGLSTEDLREPIEAPPSIYRTYWEFTDACFQFPDLPPPSSNDQSLAGLAGVDSSFERIYWYVIDQFPEGVGILGQWNPPHDITLKRKAQIQSGVIMHEILHDLLDGDGSHSSHQWGLCVNRGLLLGVDDP